jgi:hypothetical protein
MQTTTATTTTKKAEPRLGLDDLARLDFAELEALYRRGKAPESLRALDGPLVGRMLALRSLRGRGLRDAVAKLARARAFVWAGKSFSATSDRAGTGINRIRGGGLLGRQNLFPFETRIAASAVDGEPAVVLDYDLDDNPSYIRHIHDEVREVSPGIFMGPAMWKTEKSKVTLLWFALDTGRR